MTALMRSAFLLVACPVGSSAVRANNDCCFDWNNLNAGTGDTVGVAPLPSTPFGSGFQCVSRAEEDALDLSLTFINQITNPIGQRGLVVFEPALLVANSSVPSLGRRGSWVLAALLCAGGALMVRRSAGSAT